MRQHPGYDVKVGIRNFNAEVGQEEEFGLDQRKVQLTNGYHHNHHKTNYIYSQRHLSKTSELRFGLLLYDGKSTPNVFRCKQHPVPTSTMEQYGTIQASRCTKSETAWSHERELIDASLEDFGV